MIAVDTSAPMAVVLNGPAAGACSLILETEPRLLISATTLAEALIVAAGRRKSADLIQLIERLEIEVEPVTDATALAVSKAYQAWGKGFHSARLNLGDCFSYVAAQTNGCPLLYVGNDFAQTDVVSAVSADRP